MKTVWRTLLGIIMVFTAFLVGLKHNVYAKPKHKAEDNLDEVVSDHILISDKANANIAASNANLNQSNPIDSTTDIKELVDKFNKEA